MRTRVMLGLLLAAWGCTKLEDVAPGTIVTCATVADCPAGRVCNGGRCVLPSQIGSAPDLVLPPSGKLAVDPAAGRAGTLFRVPVQATKDLARPPRVTLGLETSVELECAAFTRSAYECSYTAVGTENGGLGGHVSIDVEMTDDYGQTEVKHAAGELKLDFAPPVLAVHTAAPTFVPLNGVLQVFFTTDEPLQGPAVLVASRPFESGGETRFSLEAEAGTLNHLFTHLVTTSDDAGPIDFTVELMDAVGNATVASVGGVVVDNSAPVVTNLKVTPARTDPTGVVTVTFDATEVGSLAVFVGGHGMACAYRSGSPSYICTFAMSGDEIPAGKEEGEPVVVNLTDLAGNVGSAVGNVVFDFRPPDVIAGSVATTLAPPPGSLAGGVTALGVGGTIRVSFMADEPLASMPKIITSPEALEFSPVSQSGTFYVFEHQLSSDPHAQGAYTAQVLLTDLAGNQAVRALTPGAPGRVVHEGDPLLRVDTVAPVVPDVTTPSRTRYDRVPWGTVASAGAPLFTVTGEAGAVEAGATVVAFDGPDVATARELGRAVADGDGAFGPMPLIPADRREVFLVAVDGAGNPSDGDEVTVGVQATRVRDVAWTATLLNKVAGSTAKNPHRLETRARWLGALEQGASVEATLPAATRGTLAWTLAASPDWATGRAAYDARRGKLVVPTSGYVSEWDGEVWTSVATAGGPVMITAIAYDARRGEVLVYDGNCAGGTTLWAWRGSEWEARAVGASYTEWRSSGGPAPGVHWRASLVYDEARGEVILAPGAMFGAGPYVCGDFAGALDYATYRWDGSAWSALPGPSADGLLLGYDVARGVVLRVNASGTEEWDGSTWTTVSVADPEGDGNPSSISQVGSHDTAVRDTVWDPVLERILLQSDGYVWSWSGTSWRRESASVDGALVLDPSQSRALSLAPAGIYQWTGSEWTKQTAAPDVPHAPVGAVYSTARGRMEAFDASGNAYGWSQGSWTRIPIADPQVDGDPTTLAGAAYDPVSGLVLGYCADTTTWWFDGSSWALIAPADSVRPPGTTGMVTVSGLGAVAQSVNGEFYSWTGDRWIQRGYGGGGWGGTAYVWAPPALMPGGSGAYLTFRNSYNPDLLIVQWTPAAGYETVYSAGGMGTVRPMAADGAGRTFVLQQNGTLLLSGTSLSPGSIEDPRGVGYPTELSASAWDPSQAAVVLLSGTKTWQLETEARSRPGQLFRVSWPLGVGEGDDCFRPTSSCTLRSVDVSWSGIAAPTEGSSSSSATISVWDGMRWVPVASASAPPGVVASASGSVTDASLLPRLAGGSSPEIDLAIVMSGTSPPSPLLRTDDVSVTVKYRLP